MFARPGTGNRFMDPVAYKGLFERYGKNIVVPMLNKGFIIFQNGVLGAIRDEWLSLVNSEWPNPSCHTFPKEQIALAVALSGYRIRFMDRSIHAFGWNGEGWVDSYVLHRFTGHPALGVLKNMKHTVLEAVK